MTNPWKGAYERPETRLAPAPGPGHRPEKRRPGVRSLLAGLIAVMLTVGAGGVPASPYEAATRWEVPVLLVPGWFDTERDLAALRIRLVSAGWEPDAVAAVTFRDATGSNVDHAREIGEAADDLREATGAAEIDIVAHSMGGLATRVYLRDGAPVRRVIFVASPHQGTYAAYVAWGAGAEEMRPGSDFLAALNEGPAVPHGVQTLTIRTQLDTHIIPGRSAELVGVPDRVVCCPTHAGLLRDLEVFRVIRLFLDDGVVAGADGA